MSHVGYFPPYSHTPRPRTLALLQDGRLETEDGRHWPVRSYAEFCAVGHLHNCLVLCADCAALPWFDDVPLNHVQASFPGDPLEQPTIWVQARKGRCTIPLVPRSMWDGRDVPDQHLLYSIRLLWNRVGSIGRTPGLVGWAALTGDWNGKRHTIPNDQCAADLRRWGTSQRIETPRAGPSTRPDIGSAYPTHFRVLPTGTPVRLYRNEPEWAATWFALCRVSVPTTLVLGPFPVRDQRPTRWPTAPGTYETWLWAEQAFDAREAECTVELVQGWGWQAMTDDTAPWVDHMLAVRAGLSSDGYRLAAALAKRAANATIGRLAMPAMKRQLTTTDGGEPLLIGGRLSALNWTWVQGKSGMIHWQRYTDMQCSRTVYRWGLPYAREGRLLGIHVDQLIVAA